MDDEIEDLVYKNNTDELDDFLYELTAWDVVQDSFAVTLTFIGLAADLILIYMIARNVRMRTKTNLVIMNWAINDALFLVSNMHFVSSLFELFGATDHLSFFYNCMLRFIDVSFQFNETLFILVMISNTLLKSKRVKIKWLFGGVYSFILINALTQMILCHFDSWPILYMLCFILFMLILAVSVFKEINNCYKKWYKKDPLSARTVFRFNIGRIYIYSWFSTFFMYMISDGYTRYLFYILAQHSFIASLYILIYVVCADKNFKICLLNLLQCKGAGDYDVDATITFAEDLSEGSQDNTQVNINFNANETTTQGQEISTIRVP